MGSSITGINERLSRLETGVRRIQAYLNLEPPQPTQGADETPFMGAASQLATQPPAVGHAPPVVEPSQISGEQQLYDINMALFREEKYEDAIVGFKDFVAKYPKSDLADNAQFWVGEAYMGLKQYEQAILAFQRVIKDYPKGNKIPNAILRQAVAFYEINDKTSSKLLLKKLIKQFPKSAEAKIADGKLKAMK
jgi:tol-pal system protein YbgF